ncbi:MAG: 6,7-dimethyl-8-ribityllumazine synthase [Acidimicrobiales bacterium]
MTSSEETDLPRGAMAELAGLVGTVMVGDGEGAGVRVGVACAKFNGGITWRLLKGALEGFDECRVDRDDVRVAWAPGAFELPLVARAFAASGSVDAVVCLGAVIRGETGHYDFVAGECAAGLQRVQVDWGLPVVFGVLTTDTVDQAMQRSGPGRENKGREAAVTAVETHRLLGFQPAPVSGRAARSPRLE